MHTHVCVCVWHGGVCIHMCVCVCGMGVCAYTRVCVCVCMCLRACRWSVCVCVCDGGGEGASSGFTSINLFPQCDHLVLVLIQAEVQTDVHY